MAMDELVERALARWPNVPAIAGWLKLGTQGEWLLTGPVEEGLSISHPRILGFIARNYACESDGRYYFQNGPQKVYVHLAYTPWVYGLYPASPASVEGGLMLVSHTGLIDVPQAIYSDEQGRVLVLGSLGIGLLKSSDMDLFAQHLAQANPLQGDELVHRATWVVPQLDPSQPTNTRIAWRYAPGVLPGPTHLELPVQTLSSTKAPALFGFEPNPKVNSA